MQFDFRKLNRMRSYIWKKNFFVWCLIYDFVISPEFILRELSSYRACVVIWGNLWNSIILKYSNYFCPYNELFQVWPVYEYRLNVYLSKNFLKAKIIDKPCFFYSKDFTDLLLEREKTSRQDQVKSSIFLKKQIHTQ